MAGHPRYKTSMCIAFAKNGYCEKSSGKKSSLYVFKEFPCFLIFFTFSFLECQYAHGPQDLRPMGGGGSFGPSHPGMGGTYCNNVKFWEIL